MKDLQKVLLVLFWTSAFFSNLFHLIMWLMSYDRFWIICFAVATLFCFGVAVMGFFVYFIRWMTGETE